MQAKGALPVAGASQVLAPSVALYMVTPGLSGGAAVDTITSVEDTGVIITLAGSTKEESLV